MAEDLSLISEIGARAYRFSIAWPRLFPDGVHREERGFGFYDRLVDGLLERGITPMATLYHWDLPQALQDQGGWPARDTADRFAEYASACYRAYGDRVPMWITHNEPWVSGFLGHYHGIHAPGLRDLLTSLAAIHGMLRSHGAAVAAYRADGQRGQIGITLNLNPTYPASESEADRDAARRSDGYTNRWFLDPVLRGTYPADLLDIYARAVGPLDFIQAGDLAAIATPSDFLGVNYYHRRIVKAAGPESVLPWKVVEPPPGPSVTDAGMESTPETLTDLLVRLRDDYPLPLYITENGCAYDDPVSADGRVHDERRVAFYRGHFEAAHRAIEAGADLRGYFCWSLLDNFEWAMGYAKRFGLIHTDFATQKRTPKDSAVFLRSVIDAHGL
jgi:beta-glucosidase